MIRSRHGLAAVLLAGATAAAFLAACRPEGPSEPSNPTNPDPDPTFTVTLEWTAPTVDAEGRPLDDLVGYSVHYRATSPADGPGATSVDVGNTTRSTVEGVPAGSWFFGVTASDASGNESVLSNQVEVEVGP